MAYRQLAFSIFYNKHVIMELAKLYYAAKAPREI